MSSPNLTEGWRSSSSFLLGLYSLLLVLWGCVLVWLISWKVSCYMDGLARDTLLQRSMLFRGVAAERLQDSLEEHYQLDTRSLNHYGLFDASGQPLSGHLGRIPSSLPMDGNVHVVPCPPGPPPRDSSTGSCHALATKIADGRALVLIRDSRNSSLSDVIRIVLRSLILSLPFMAIPGAIGWHLLRWRPLRRIQSIDRACRRIVMGDMTERLPVSSRRDELDMLCSIVNAMLARIEKLMGEIKTVSDSIAHDLRTPLTRLHAHLHRLRMQTSESPLQVRQLDRALEETNSLLVRFRALLRISELEIHVRRSGFVDIAPASLLQEIHAFYLPLAEEHGQRLELQMEPALRLPSIRGDRALLFEALSNLIDNALKFTPHGGRVVIQATTLDDAIHIGIADSGPGIPESERTLVLQRFYRGSNVRDDGGLGMGLSIVLAIMDLHGFRLEIGDAMLGGARVGVICRRAPPLLSNRP